MELSQETSAPMTASEAIAAHLRSENIALQNEINSMGADPGRAQQILRSGTLVLGLAVAGSAVTAGHFSHESAHLSRGAVEEAGLLPGQSNNPEEAIKQIHLSDEQLATCFKDFNTDKLLVGAEVNWSLASVNEAHPTKSFHVSQANNERDARQEHARFLLDTKDPNAKLARDRLYAATKDRPGLYDRILNADASAYVFVQTTEHGTAHTTYVNVNGSISPADRDEKAGAIYGLIYDQDKDEVVPEASYRFKCTNIGCTVTATPAEAPHAPPMNVAPPTNTYVLPPVAVQAPPVIVQGPNVDVDVTVHTETGVTVVTPRSHNTIPPTHSTTPTTERHMTPTTVKPTPPTIKPTPTTVTTVKPHGTTTTTTPNTTTTLRIHETTTTTTPNTTTTTTPNTTTTTTPNTTTTTTPNTTTTTTPNTTTTTVPSTTTTLRIHEPAPGPNPGADQNHEPAPTSTPGVTPHDSENTGGTQHGDSNNLDSGQTGTQIPDSQGGSQGPGGGEQGTVGQPNEDNNPTTPASPGNHDGITDSPSDPNAQTPPSGDTYNYPTNPGDPAPMPPAPGATAPENSSDQQNPAAAPPPQNSAAPASEQQSFAPQQGSGAPESSATFTAPNQSSSAPAESTPVAQSNPNATNPSPANTGTGQSNESNASAGGPPSGANQ